MFDISVSYLDEFQFTHPGRGATSSLLTSAKATLVSIHAPREGCDTDRRTFVLNGFVFQFTHPGRGATGKTLVGLEGELEVSIHAPREGCDDPTARIVEASWKFQFTHPGRGATWSIRKLYAS